MKECPRCAKAIQDDAQICKWCHSDLAVGPQTLMPQTTGKATVSLILGIFSFIFPAAVLAIIFGHLSRSDIKRSRGCVTGAGRALAGLVLGYTGAALPLALILAAILIPNFVRARIAANQAVAVGSLRTYNSAEVTLASRYSGLPMQACLRRSRPKPAVRRSQVLCWASASLTGLGQFWP